MQKNPKKFQKSFGKFVFPLDKEKNLYYNGSILLKKR